MPKTMSSETAGIADFPFTFEARAPKGDLGRFVESIWYARGTISYRREKIAPTGSTVAVIILGDPIVDTANNGKADPVRSDTGFLIGPHDGPVINEPTGETYAMGIVTTPVGCEAVFGVRPGTVRGRVVELVNAWAPAGDLRESLVANGDRSAMLDALEAALEPVEVRGTRRVASAVSSIEDDPRRPIEDIAKSLELSHAHLDREFGRIVGLSPRRLARLLRVRRLLEEIDVRGSNDWAEFAHAHGWFDQAHLIRDFKRHTGVTPTQYVLAQQSVYSPVEDGDAAGFVPER